MRIRTLIVIGLALVCGISAAAGVVMMQGRLPKQEQVTSMEVAVAKSDITRGKVITEDMLSTATWPASAVGNKTIRNVADAVGRTATSTILKGEPVSGARLTEPGDGKGIAALIPDGFRAYTIQTSRIASNVAGFVMPGHRVDVLLTLRGGRDDETGGGSSTTLLQAVEILAVNGSMVPPDEQHLDPKEVDSVTLLVNPEQVALLDLGQNMGTLTLSLRNTEDIAESMTAPATVNAIRFSQQLPVMPGDGDDIREWLVKRKADALRAEKQLASADGESNESTRVEAMRVPVPELIPKPASTDATLPNTAESIAPPLPAIESIQTFRGRHNGRVLVRSSNRRN